MISKQIFDGTAITKNTSSDSEVIDMIAAGCTDGLCSLHITETGDGTSKYTYLLSCDGGQNYVEQSATADVITEGFVKTSGPGGDGKDVIEFEVELCTNLKIRVTETGNSSTIKPNVWLCAK
jgi:hypothetical protein